MEVAKQSVYDGLPNDAMGKLQRLAIYVLKAKAKAAGAIIDAGEHVAEAHKLLVGIGREGRFSGWVEAECHFSRTTAYRLINVYEVFDKYRELVPQFDDSALYALSEQSTPEDAIKKAIRLAKKGRYISKSEAKQIVSEATEKVSHRVDTSDETTDDPETYETVDADFVEVADPPESEEPDDGEQASDLGPDFDRGRNLIGAVAEWAEETDRDSEHAQALLLWCEDGLGMIRVWETSGK